MFLIYLRRELRRRMRQATFIALGLALGTGLVITVTAAAAGVRNAQSAVLHSLYGVGTDVTITQPPKQRTGTGISFGFRQQIKQVRSGQIAAGTKIDDKSTSWRRGSPRSWGRCPPRPPRPESRGSWRSKLTTPPRTPSTWR